MIVVRFDIQKEGDIEHIDVKLLIVYMSIHLITLH